MYRRQLGAQGCRSMLAVPVSFVSEHIETLEEMDMEYRELAEASGIKNWRRVPALNTNATFIGDLADAVLQALPFAGSMAGSNPGDSLVPLGAGNDFMSPLVIGDGVWCGGTRCCRRCCPFMGGMAGSILDAWLVHLLEVPPRANLRKKFSRLVAVVILQALPLSGSVASLDPGDSVVLLGGGLLLLVGTPAHVSGCSTPGAACCRHHSGLDARLGG